MPRGDGTGPQGMGSMTGRGAGYCAGFDRPGAVNFNISRYNRNPRNSGFFSNPLGRGRGLAPGRGMGRGRGRRR